MRTLLAPFLSSLRPSIASSAPVEESKVFENWWKEWEGRRNALFLEPAGDSLQNRVHDSL